MISGVRALSLFGFHPVLSLGSTNMIRDRGRLGYSPGVFALSQKSNTKTYQYCTVII